MSIINQMLNDLHRRQAPAYAGGNDSHHTEQYEQTALYSLQKNDKKPILKIIFSVTALILLSVTCTFTYLIYKDKSSLSFADQNKDIQSANPTSNTSKVIPDAASQQVAVHNRAATIQNKPAAIPANKNSQAVTMKPVTDKPVTIKPEQISKPVSTKSSVAGASVTSTPSHTIAVNNRKITPDSTAVTENKKGKVTGLTTNVTPNTESVNTSITAVNKQALALTPGQQAEVAYKEGYQLLQQSKIYSAEVKLLMALEHNVKHLKAREVLAGLYLKTGRKVEAEDILRKGILFSPNYSLYKKLYARLLLDNNKVNDAIAVLLKNKPAMANDLNYYALLAASYQRNKNHNAAASTYLKLLKIKPREGIWWVGMAVSLEALSKHKEASDAYEKARQTGTLNTRVSNYSSQRLQQLGIQLQQ